MEKKKEYCSVKDCTRKVLAIGLCWKHYAYTRGVCPVEGCKNPIRSKGLCGTHYDNMRGVYAPRRSVSIRFWSKVTKTETCWIWNGAKQSTGYGSVKFEGRVELAHRVAWAFYRGGLEPYIQLTQLCHNLLCVNPDHLSILNYANDFRLTKEQKFLRRVRKTETCWLWIGQLDRHGYGAFRDNSRTMKAHRTAWEMYRGQIPDNMVVCHNCPSGDNPSCVNPDHLFIGTQGDNTRDMDKKGRRGTTKGYKYNVDWSGSNNGNAKIDQETADKIRERYRTVRITQSELAREFDVSPATVSLIVTGQRWVKDLLPATTPPLRCP